MKTGSFYFYWMEDKSWLGLSRWTSTSHMSLRAHFRYPCERLPGNCGLFAIQCKCQASSVGAGGSFGPESPVLDHLYKPYTVYNKYQGTLAQLKEMVALICKWVLDVTVQNSSLWLNWLNIFCWKRKKRYDSVLISTVSLNETHSNAHESHLNNSWVSTKWYFSLLQTTTTFSFRV